MNAITRTPYAGWGLLGDFDDIVNGFFAPARAADGTEGSRAPAMDITETEDGYEIRADLPGVNKDDLSVTVKDGVLTIEAKSASVQERKDGDKVIRRERHFGRYVRTLRLGESVDDSKIAAKYADGVLELKLPRAEKAGRRQIEVNVH